MMVDVYSISHPEQMFVTKKTRLAIYHNLFKEGVMVAKKDFHSIWIYKSKDGDKDLSLPNLEVINVLKSLKSRGYVKETFNWQYYYWYLTVEGIDYLREYLNLPQDVVPQTHTKKETRPARPGGFAGDRPDRKRLGPDDNFEPTYGGGFGRGRDRGGEREYRS